LLCECRRTSSETQAVRLSVGETDVVRADIDLRSLTLKGGKATTGRAPSTGISGAWAERENLDEEMKEIRSRSSRR
jgi:hypothetical protein